MERAAADQDAGQMPPLHLRPSSIAAVAVGALVGTTLRYLLGLAVPTAPGGWPIATFTVNVIGAFVLAGLLELLASAGPDEGRRRTLRLALGTGLLGSFTTYSALALDTVHLLEAGRVWAASGYAIGSVVMGLLAAACGLFAAQSLVTRRARSEGTR